MVNIDCTSSPPSSTSCAASLALMTSKRSRTSGSLELPDLRKLRTVGAINLRGAPCTKEQTEQNHQTSGSKASPGSSALSFSRSVSLYRFVSRPTLPWTQGARRPHRTNVFRFLHSFRPNVPTILDFNRQLLRMQWCTAGLFMLEASAIACACLHVRSHLRGLRLASIALKGRLL